MVSSIGAPWAARRRQPAPARWARTAPAIPCRRPRTGRRGTGTGQARPEPRRAVRWRCRTAPRSPWRIESHRRSRRRSTSRCRGPGRRRNSHAVRCGVGKVTPHGPGGGRTDRRGRPGLRPGPTCRCLPVAGQCFPLVDVELHCLGHRATSLPPAPDRHLAGAQHEVRAAAVQRGNGPVDHAFAAAASPGASQHPRPGKPDRSVAGLLGPSRKWQVTRQWFPGDPWATLPASRWLARQGPVSAPSMRATRSAMACRSRRNSPNFATTRAVQGQDQRHRPYRTLPASLVQLRIIP